MPYIKNLKNNILKKKPVFESEAARRWSTTGIHARFLSRYQIRRLFVVVWRHRAVGAGTPFLGEDPCRIARGFNASYGLFERGKQGEARRRVRCRR
ncbi:hypothetical protein THIOKS12710012 [Thiocapsa sp. KS1]|nr:hypothetical protein THIOKS12710012 [Thiocapsa sp. KS1]